MELASRCKIARGTYDLTVLGNKFIALDRSLDKTFPMTLDSSRQHLCLYYKCHKTFTLDNPFIVFHFDILSAKC